MKKLVKTSALLIITIAVAFAVRCTPEDHPNNGGNDNGSVEEPQYYSISVLANPQEGGTVSGGGSIAEGQSCTVTATPATGYTFTDWTENDVQISTNACYTFTVTCNRSLMANFTSNGGNEEPKYYTVNISSSPSDGGWATGDGRYQEGQSCTVTATPNNLYTFTNWTENGSIVSDSVSYTFTVTYNRNLMANFTFMNAGSYVDLGLPSGTLWAACNIGANTPAEYGDYFAWGETEPKNNYGCDNYQYCNGCEYNGDIHLITITKYCNHSTFGYNGFTDELTTLLPEDDAATALWGKEWRLPSKEDWEELLNNTTGIFTTLNGAHGILLTATNGACLFLPAAGFHSDYTVWYAGSCGSYWTSSLDEDAPDGAWGLSFTSDNGRMGTSFRFCGRSMRAVR